ncbi:hypothetical protein Ancab_035033 [Ancistrocladus abbreviatus]
MKVKDNGKEQFLPLSEGNDYGLSNLDDVQPCNRKGIHVSNAGTSNSTDDRDELHMLSLGKILKGALMDDMKASAERIEKGMAIKTAPRNTARNQSNPKFPQGGGYRSSGEDGGSNLKRAVVDPDRSEPSIIAEKIGKPIKKQGLVTKNIGGRPNKVGLKRKTPKIPKKINKKWTSPADTG